MDRVALAAQFGLAHRHLHFLIAHPIGARIGMGHEVITRQVQLDCIDAVFEESAHSLAHFLGAANHFAEAECFVRQMRQGVVAQRARHGDFRARRQIARTGHQAFIDRIADHHVQSWLCRGRTAGRGPSMVEVEFGVAGREQHVLFQRHQLDRVQGRGVVPGQMHMGFGHARHQSGAGGIDHLHACNRCRASAASYARDAIAWTRTSPA